MAEHERDLDKIHIRDLRLRCIIGANEEERHEKQDVTLNITLYVDLRKACQSDHLEDTVDYKSVKKEIIAMVEGSSFFLIERMADEAACICLGESLVEKVKVRIEKPGALRFARTVDVEIVRTLPG